MYPESEFLFQYNPTTSTYTKKVDFGKTDGTSTALVGSSPYGSLIQASDGNLYGMTQEGGISAFNSGPDGPFDRGRGVLFKYIPATSAYSVIYNFQIAGCIGYPQGSLMQASDGNFYGMTYIGPPCGTNADGTLFQFNPVTSAYTNELNFTGANGKNPVYTNLVEVRPSTTLVPTLSQWAFITLSVLVLGAGVFFVRGHVV